MSLRINTRRFRFGLATLLGRRRGFFIPYRYADRLAALGHRPIYESVQRRFQSSAPQFVAQLDAVEEFADDLRAIGDQPAPAPRWDQDWFPRLDAAMAYAMVRHHRPSRIVEVGSGHSTRFMARAVADGALPAQMVAIDPAPRATLRSLAVEWLPATVPSCGLQPFQRLAKGDILFIDSSHILMPGTDIDFLFGEVLPLVPAGALVHLHDIFLPDDYPQSWAWRGYNEQAAVALLLDGPWEVLFASRYVATRMAQRLESGIVGRLPCPPGAFETSLWLRRRSA
ncbi:MAG TPA: class I SAM-dependent methyltransferase [Dongiaceae bacterium]|jgi:hypothetical protein